MIIKVTEDMLECDSSDAQSYLNTINGIIYDCWHNHGFESGWRNTIAVDLSVCCHMLGIDAIEMLGNLIKAKIIDPADDDEDTTKRVATCLDYKDRFSWNWMIDAYTYYGMGEDHRLEWDLMPVNVRFVH